jgi:hypothetical protein
MLRLSCDGLLPTDFNTNVPTCHVRRTFQQQNCKRTEWRTLNAWVKKRLAHTFYGRSQDHVGRAICEFLERKWESRSVLERRASVYMKIQYPR